MKNCLFCLLLIVITAGLSAFGRKQVEEEIEPINSEWTLCITAFDASSMSPSWQTAGDTVARSFASALGGLDFRFRDDKETVYYRDYAWVKSRAEAADALVKKRNERDLLIFRGDPPWKYQKDLKAAEDAILKLEEELAEIDAKVPVVEEKPVFTLTQQNLNGVFPLPPEPGMEYRFCTEEKVDAFLAGSLSEYYGRIFLDIKMYTRYTTSYSYENSILFSAEDFNMAVDEITDHLAAVVSVVYPSAILVRSSPSDAMVLIDGIYAGQGEVELRTRSPGEAEITVYADSHLPATIPLELNSGELAELIIELSPLGRTILHANVPEKPGSKVFLGGLYMGETPLALELPGSQFSYVSVETPEGEIGSVILRDNSLIRGNAQFATEYDFMKADFLTAFPVSKEEKIVETARGKFYKTYGVFWIALPVALLAGGIAGTYIASNDYVTSNNLYGNDPEKRARINSNANFGSLIQTASYGLIGASLGLTFYRIYNYLKNSSGDSTPIVKVPPKAEETKQ